MKGLLKWLFNKDKGDEDPIVIEDTDEPIVEIIKSPQFTEEVMKNISVIPKEATKVIQEKPPEVPQVTVLPEITVVVPEPPKVPEAPKPPVVPKNFNDGFTSTGSLYGTKRR